MNSSKRVVLHPDCTVHVYIQNRQVEAHMHGISTINDLIKLLAKISKFLPCNASDNQRATDCKVYVFEKDKCKRGRQTKTCRPCKKHQNSMRRGIRKTGSLSKFYNSNKTLRNENKM